MAVGSMSRMAAWPTSMAAMCAAMKLRCVFAFRPFPDLYSSATCARVLQEDGGGLAIYFTTKSDDDDKKD